MMKLAAVTVNLLDLRAEPKHTSERLSQLLYGDVVSLYQRRNGFVKVREADGYSGWVDERFLTVTRSRPPRPPQGWKWGIVSDWTCWLNTSKGEPLVPPFFFYYGTRLVVKRHSRGILQVRLTDGTTRKISERAIRILGHPNLMPVRRLIGLEARKFIGVPYLWGGITTPGFDCSGFVRALFRQFGIELPRDTKDQIKAGVKIARSEVQPGDLLFFDRHVGIAMLQNRLIHASRGGGGVRVNSLHPGEPDYRADLDRDFQSARRILGSH